MIQVDYSKLVGTPVFIGLEASQIEKLLKSVGAYEEYFDRGQVIREMGEELDAFPIVITGLVKASLVEGDRRQIVQQFGVGSSFAEAVPVSMGRCPVEIVAVKKTHLVFIPADNIKAARGSAAKTTWNNLMHEMSLKVSTLSTKLSVMNSPRLSDRLLAYLKTLPRNEDGSVTVPFKYRDLAEYLGVNNTSLSRSMHRLEDEGVLRAEGRTVWICKEAADGSRPDDDMQEDDESGFCDLDDLDCTDDAESLDDEAGDSAGSAGDGDADTDGEASGDDAGAGSDD